MGFMPPHAEPSTLGNIVEVLVFKRVAPGEDTLVADTLTKYVGVLQSYSGSKDDFSFRLEGSGPTFVNHHREYVEIHIHPDFSQLQ